MSGREKCNPGYTKDWQEDRAVAAGARNSGFRGRKVRTPQGSVPDNVRDVGLKTHGRPVPQKRYRLGYPSFGRASGWALQVRLDGQSRRGKGEMVR